MNAKLRCLACKTSARVNQCVGVVPLRFPHRNSARRAKDAAAREILSRYAVGELNDRIDDLFQTNDGGRT
jgi:hypothetical protein